MKIFTRTMLSIFLIINGLYASDVIKLHTLGKPALQWVVTDGQPLYVSSPESFQNMIGERVGPLYMDGSVLTMKLSPNAAYRVISLLQPMDQVKDGKRFSDFYVYDSNDELLYTTSKGTGADLKAHVAAVSDNGILALVDPVNAVVSFYSKGDMLSESQLYQTEGDHSLERNAFVDWVGDRCYVLIERPGQGGMQAKNAIMISIDPEGRDQVTSILPFTYILDHVFDPGQYFVSGYSYNPSTKQFSPLVMSVDATGKALWTNENFGHELALSQNGSYLAARKSHDGVVVFNLKLSRVEEVEFARQGKAALGLSIDNAGQIGLIRVPNDFFVKKNSHHAEVYFPRSGASVGVQLDPALPQMFKLHSDGYRFLLGTQYEWLEIRE